MHQKPAFTFASQCRVLRIYHPHFAPIVPRPAAEPQPGETMPATLSPVLPSAPLRGVPSRDDDAVAEASRRAIFREPPQAAQRPAVCAPIPLAVLRNDHLGAQARRRAVAALTDGATEDDDLRRHRIVLLMLADPLHGPAMRLLRERLPSWNAVSDALGLACSRPNARGCGPLSRFMTSDPELQRRQRGEAYTQLKRRERNAEDARADRHTRATLVHRLQALTAALHFVARPRTNDTLDWQDDFVLAAADHGVAERSACMWRFGATALAEALGLPDGRCVGAPLLQNGGWRQSLQRRIDGLLARQADGEVERPERVAVLRARLAGVMAGMAVAAQAATEAKALPDILYEAQRLDPAILARKATGGEWLDGLDTTAARVSDRSWRHFEQHELLPARLPKARWPALRESIDSVLRGWLQDAGACQARTAQGFEMLTTLDDGEERGMGVATRAPLPCFEPLFFYGGTVCLGADAADGYRALHPEAWRYAMEVGLPPGDGDQAAPPDATCFGYPLGNLASRINARRLLGSDTQRQRAANVTMLSVRVPGLPFGLPLLLTRQPVAADEELFLDYGRDFGRFVQQSLAALPRWPTVKTEPRLPEAATLAGFLHSVRALPFVPDPDGAIGPQPTPRAPALPPGWELRMQAQCGDSCLFALEGGRLDAATLQQLRHDLADVIARWPDGPGASRRNGREVAHALGRDVAVAGAGAVDASLNPGVVRLVPHNLRAELVRVAGQPCGLNEIRAWCQLDDERKRSRATGRGWPRPTGVALLTPDGRLWRVDASGCRPVVLAGLDAAKRDSRLARALREADVALLQQGTQFSEIVWAGAAGEPVDISALAVAAEQGGPPEASVKVPAS